MSAGHTKEICRRCATVSSCRCIGPHAVEFVDSCFRCNALVDPSTVVPKPPRRLPYSGRTCYVAGPMRRWPEKNYPAFYDAERRLTAAGWAVYNPARLSDEELPHVPSDGAPRSCREFAKQDLHVIVTMLEAEHGDAVVILPGWNLSRGSAAEVAVARWVRLPVLTLDEATR